VREDELERPVSPIEYRRQLSRTLAETKRNIAAQRVAGRPWPTPRSERRAATRLLYEIAANGSICPAIQAAVRRIRDPVDPATLPATLRWAFEHATPARSPYPATAGRVYRRQWRRATTPRPEDQPEHGESFRSVYELHMYWLVCAELAVCVNCTQTIANDSPERYWPTSGHAGDPVLVFAPVRGAHHCRSCYREASDSQRHRIAETVNVLRQKLDIRGGKPPSHLRYIMMNGLPPEVHTE
jgi:hypothetical protein